MDTEHHHDNQNGLPYDDDDQFVAEGELDPDGSPIDMTQFEYEHAMYQQLGKVSHIRVQILYLEGFVMSSLNTGIGPDTGLHFTLFYRWEFLPVHLAYLRHGHVRVTEQ